MLSYTSFRHYCLASHYYYIIILLYCYDIIIITSSLFIYMPKSVIGWLLVFIIAILYSSCLPLFGDIYALRDSSRVRSPRAPPIRRWFDMSSSIYYVAFIRLLLRFTDMSSSFRQPPSFIHDGRGCAIFC